MTEQEQKARFFAQYFGQIVARNNYWLDEENTNKITCTQLEPLFVKNGHLLLTPLSAINEQQALVVAKIFDINFSETNESAHFDLVGFSEWLEALFEEAAGYYIDGYTGNQLLSATDYLRSESFALPFMGHTVEEMESKGWLKLKEVV